MNFICFDTEDNSRELLEAGKSGFDKRVTQIAAITGAGATYYNKGNVAAFLKWLEARTERFVYAHNLQYDLGNLFGRVIDKLDVTMIGGRMIKALWRGKVFVDSFNIWPMSAKQLGKVFGLRKLDFDSQSKAYVFRDVEIIWQAMSFAWKFCQTLGVDYCPATVGGLAVKIWRNLGGDNCHDSSALSRQALYGGRVELFKPSSVSDSVCYTDVNSLYPSVMLGKFPGPLSECFDVPDNGVACVTVRQPETDLPVLPLRNDSGRVVYPWGTFTGTWTAPEIREAVKRGAKILKLHAALGSEELTTPYADFVRTVYRARMESKTWPEREFFKRVLNNLYGRLGVTGELTRSVEQTERNQFDGVRYGSKVLVTYKMPLSQETNWCHAAYVTAGGRLRLLDFVRQIGAEAMIYADTDSTIFDCPTRKIPFAVGADLGQMKLVSWETACACYAPKLYQVGNDYKAKGVPKRLAKRFIQTRHVEFEMPFRFREAVAFFDRKNTKRLSVWRRVEKFWRENYDRKRLIGGRFFPCKVNAV